MTLQQQLATLSKIRQHTIPNTHIATHKAGSWVQPCNSSKINCGPKQDIAKHARKVDFEYFANTELQPILRTSENSWCPTTESSVTNYRNSTVPTTIILQGTVASTLRTTHANVGLLSSFHPRGHANLVTWNMGWLNIEKYDGYSNMKTHVKAYLTWANLFSRDLRIQCQLFTTTLKGATLMWYYSLPPYLIDSFKTFCARFTSWFATINPF